MQILHLVSRAYKGFNDADGWAMASHIALSVMMALFPFMIFTSALAAFIGGPIKTADLVELVFEFWPDDIARPIAREVKAVLSGNNVGLLTFGIPPLSAGPGRGIRCLHCSRR